MTARFRMMDGRTFEADKDIRVRVLPIKDRPPVVPLPILPQPTPEEKPPEKMPPAEGPTLTSGKPAAMILRPVPAADE